MRKARAIAFTFEEHRSLLFAIAYRMLGSVAEAEDVVQDAFLRYQRALSDGVEIDSPKAYLSAVVTRLSIDALRSARMRRESYVGEWLPEPIVGNGLDADPIEHAETADSLSMAFLLVLERLNPVERAVFLLHDVFGFEYAEIATTIGKSEANCRQLAARARQHVQSERPRFDAPRAARDELASRFFAALTGGDVEQLVDLLAADAVLYGDAGGNGPSWGRPIVGGKRIARLLAPLGGQMARLGVSVQFEHVNGQPGAVLTDRDGQLVNVLALDIVDGAVHTVRSIINPDKLRHLGPLADVPALLRARNT